MGDHVSVSAWCFKGAPIKKSEYLLVREASELILLQTDEYCGRVTCSFSCKDVAADKFFWAYISVSHFQHARTDAMPWC
jgi:hypothetical protein